MRKWKIAAPMAVVAAGLIFTMTPSYGKAEYTKKEKKSCVVCHTTMKSKDLNDVGKCYKDKGSLAGREAKER